MDAVFLENAYIALEITVDEDEIFDSDAEGIDALDGIVIIVSEFCSDLHRVEHSGRQLPPQHLPLSFSCRSAVVRHIPRGRTSH